METIKTIWLEIRNDFEMDNFIHIDGWQTEDDCENGQTIAKVNVLTKEVEYIDERAKTDSLAQTAILDAIKSLS